MDDLGELRPEGVKGVVSGRPWHTEAQLLQVPNKNWEGKRILSMATGKKFDDPQEVFPGAEVTALDSSFFTDDKIKYEDLDKKAKENLVIHGKTENTADHAVKGLAQELPFADESFDLVMSTFGVPMNLGENDKVTSIIEFYRVCKKGGQVRLYPVDKELARSMVFALNADTADFEYKLVDDGSANILVVTRK